MQIAPGQQATLNWSATNADSCQASGDWSGSRSTSGSSQTGSLNSDRTYRLSCQGPGGSTLSTVTVRVVDPDAPAINLSTSTTQATIGESVTVSWSTQNLDSCSASGGPGWSGSVALEGQQSVGPLEDDVTLRLSCSSERGDLSRTVNIEVDNAPLLELSASPRGVQPGGSTTLTWSSNRADSCTASGSWSGSRSTSGSETIANIESDMSFRLECSGPGGNASTTIGVTVRAAQLSWEPPAQNVDGSPLDDLDGYRIYWGTSPRAYDQSVSIDDPQQTSRTISLNPGTYYFAMTAVNSDGEESAYSNEVSKEIY